MSVQQSKSPDSGNSPKRDDNILKRGTRVEIIGNVRTKPGDKGRLGVVKDSNGLGGWHEVGTPELGNPTADSWMGKQHLLCLCYRPWFEEVYTDLLMALRVSLAGASIEFCVLGVRCAKTVFLFQSISK
jgi:hypothetical protein